MDSISSLMASYHLLFWFSLSSQQMGNNLAEQQVNNNNEAITKQQTQEQLSSPLSKVLMIYDFENCENCELNTEIIFIYH